MTYRAAAGVARVVAGTLLASVTATAPAWSAPFVGPPAPPRVQYADGLVTMHVDGAPLSEVLARLVDAARMRLRGHVASDRAVTVRLDEVPLRQAVERLLVDQNFTLRYAADGRPRRLTLRGLPLATVRPVGPASRVAGSRLARLAFHQRFGRHPPLAIGGVLANALGSSQARLPRIARATANRNPAVRRTAMRRVLNAIESDPLLRGGLEAMTAQEVAHFARSNAHAYAPELASFLAANARSGGIRRRARAAQPILR